MLGLRSFQAVSRRVPLGQLRLLSTAIDPKQLKVERAPVGKQQPAPETLLFGHTFTDHMLTVSWNEKAGWSTPTIKPFGNLSLHPAASVLHYSLEAFEGMKAYIDTQGKARLFRPDMNMKRLNNSAQRLTFPSIDEQGFLECIKELVRVDKKWIPKLDGYSLYIRPTLISTTPYLGVGRVQDALLYVILSPVGPYYTDFKAIKLLADDKYQRAWPGGTGAYKIGGNYAPTIMPQLEASKKGYTQILWISKGTYEITEVGTMNLFVYWKNERGEKELITCPLDGTVLPGVTRDSIIQLTKSWGMKVVERSYTMNDILRGLKESRIIEVFGAGTAAIVSPIEAIHFQGKEWKIPLDSENPQARIGKLAEKLFRTILDIQYGRVKHDWSVVID